MCRPSAKCDAIASELHVSERTLQRRLEEKKTTFVELLDSTRREFADERLGRLPMSLAQAAYLVASPTRAAFSMLAGAGSNHRPGNIAIS